MIVARRLALRPTRAQRKLLAQAAGGRVYMELTREECFLTHRGHR